ncbi:MAG TPA: GatB/YqeY domain-containing protein [Desulfobacterales bacterium]|nr:GatB/YqeY domain-containing protein [Desulfobacterales bacterium]
MALNDRIVEDLKEAMRSRDQLKTSCLRMLKTSIKNRQIEKGRELSDDEILSVISSLVRKGKEAAQEYRKAGRQDLAEKEERELEVFYTYLPKQLSDEEIEQRLREIISQVSATGPKDLGKVMKIAMAKMAGQAEGKKVSQIAKGLLN